MSNINITVTEQDPINVSIASPEVQNVDINATTLTATVSDGDKGDIVVSGGGTVWTLDPNALATRVPYTGATSDVNLGEFGLLTGNLEFDTTPTNAPTGAGSMVWNDTEGTVDLVLKGGNLVLPIGQKQTIRAVNGTGGNLTRIQYRAVKIIGAQGQRAQIGLARADNDANSKDTIGIVGEDISNNQEGFIVTSGLIEEIDTTGSLQSETWADGDTLYLSGTTSGIITNVKPAAPIHTVILGFVVYAHANHGKIYVKVDNGYELDELHNVNVSTAASGDYLRYNGTTWVDATISAADLPTGIDAAKIATGTVSNTEFGYLDGVTSAIQTQLNGKQATLTNPVTGTGVSGQVSFFNGTSTVTGDNGLFWDNTNKRLGIGTTNPNASLNLSGSGDKIIRMAPTAGGAYIELKSTNNYDAIYFGTTSQMMIGGWPHLGNMQFRTGSTERMRITAAGRLLVGTTTESTYLLDVAGDIRNTTSAYFATSSGGVGIGTTSVTATYSLDVNGNTRNVGQLLVIGGLQSIMTSAGTPIQAATSATSGNSTVMSLRNNTSSQHMYAVQLDAGQVRHLATWAGGTGSDMAHIWLTATAAGAVTEKMRLTSAGRLLIGTTTESTYLLDVAGDIRNTTSAYFATSSGGVGIGTTTLNANTTFQIASTVVAARIASSGQYNVIEAINTNVGFFQTLYYGAITRAKNGAYNAIYIGANAGSDAIFQVTGLSNVGIAVTAYGTSATNTFAIGSGTAPSTSITDGFQLYSADITAGNAAPHFRTEGGAVVKIYQQTTGVGAAAFVANTGTAVNDASTFGGYTLKQIVQALQNAGFLA